MQLVINVLFTCFLMSLAEVFLRPEQKKITDFKIRAPTHTHTHTIDGASLQENISKCLDSKAHLKLIVLFVNTILNVHKAATHSI